VAEAVDVVVVAVARDGGELVEVSAFLESLPDDDDDLIVVVLCGGGGGGCVLTTRTWQGFLPSLNLTISLTGGLLLVSARLLWLRSSVLLFVELFVVDFEFESMEGFL